MNKNKFRKLAKEEVATTYGGVWAAIVAAIPSILQFVNLAIAGISGYKLLTNSKGSIKYDGINANWDSPENNTTSPKIVTNYYTY